MADVKEQVLSFLEKCDELENCKFIMATTKIKDLLKCIVNCPSLYRLFEAVTEKFDYPAAKAECLIAVNNGVLPQPAVALPETVGERLAFIFCLLVEFDKNTLNFNEFLRRYFPEDGSYFASYRAFCNLIIKSLKDCVMIVFKDELGKPANPDSKISELISAIEIAIAQEAQFLNETALSDGDKEDGLKILNSLLNAVKAGNGELIESLVCGYYYYAAHLGFESEGTAEIINLLEAFEKSL